MIEHWDAYKIHWQAEWILMTFVAIGAISFAIRLSSVNWSIVTIGLLLNLMIYPMMLGGYDSTEFGISEAINQIVWVLFLFGNSVFLIGLFLVYKNAYEIPRFVSRTAMVLISITTIFIASGFFGIIAPQTALKVAPLINIVYLINAYYGFKINLTKPIN